MSFAASREFCPTDPLNIRCGSPGNTRDGSRYWKRYEHTVRIGKIFVVRNPRRGQRFWKEHGNVRYRCSCTGFRHPNVLAGADCAFGDSINRPHRIICVTNSAQQL